MSRNEPPTDMPFGHLSESPTLRKSRAQMWVKVRHGRDLPADSISVALGGKTASSSRSYGILQEKFASSSILPVPLYFATCG